MRRTVCLILLLLGFSACATNAAPTNSPTATRRPAPTRTTVPYADIGLCGEVTVIAKPPRLVSDRASATRGFDCLARAFQECGAATLNVREQDTGILRQFGVGFLRACELTQAFQPTPDVPPAFVTCGMLQKRVPGLFIGSCSHLGDYFIPGQ